ncbi:type I restriction-modification system subunit M [Candidatus Poribacteria bacterium]|nr:MAG: type I restriction-modification system subunit M [Candidatus Poribacteria bacterium]
MAIKKSQLYASLWQSCDELRGGMDASQYKDYILTLLFMKYISDKAASPDGSLIYVPDGGGFADMVKLKGDIEIGDKVNKIIGKLADENEILKGVIDLADFNDESKLGRGREMVERISKLIAIFEGLDLRMNRAEGDDLLGDAYEYLMRHFATESGKSKGQFYTPAEVSRVMAKVIGIGQSTRRSDTIYDPTCGSGSLLLRAVDESPDGMSVFGQEKDNATYALAWMNMILHGDETAELRHGNTLSAPDFTDENGLKTFDFAVANPPFSDKAWTTGLNPEHDAYERFKHYGVPPAKNGDYAFLLHFIASLKSTGKGAIILPHGVLFRGNKEGDIRRNLIRRGYIKGIIGLPANLFYGTGIPACILVIDKENAHARNGIFMIDASKGFLKDGNKNRLRAQDIHKIVSVFNAQIELPRYSRMVPLDEITDPSNDYNLNIPRYIDASEPEDLHDLGAHLNGGIPDTDIDALNTYWTVFPTLRNVLFKANGRLGYSDPLVETQQVKTTILTHPEFNAYQAQINAVFEAWRETHELLLLNIEIDTSPREIIQTLSEDLLNRFTSLPLLDPYDVYQKLMDYWDEVMQDDVYLIAADGWVEAAKPREVIQDKQVKETPDLVIKKNRYKMDLIPPGLIVARYFAEEQVAVEALEAKRTTAESELAEYIEEHTGEDGLLTDALNDSGNITTSSVKARLKAIQGEPDSTDEREVLTSCAILIDTPSKISRAVKKEQEALDEQVLAHYPTLTENEIKAVVVEDKWIASVQLAIESEVQRLTQALTARVQELEKRYAQPLPELASEVDKFSAKVNEHLQKMGVDWV